MEYTQPTSPPPSTDTSVAAPGGSTPPPTDGAPGSLEGGASVSSPTEGRSEATASPHPLSGPPPLTNSQAAQRRIDNKNSRMSSRMAELEQRIQQLEGDSRPEARVLQDNLIDKYNTYADIQADTHASQFEDRVIRELGANSAGFMESMYKYSPYINRNEPDLLKYTQRPYGLHLLQEWMNRMENPQLQNMWMGMTSLEKSQTLASFYSQIEKARGNLNREPTKPIPAPSGGRESGGLNPTDDFGIAVQRAYQSRGLNFNHAH